MRKKWILVMTGMAVAASLFSGCGTSSKEAGSGTDTAKEETTEAEDGAAKDAAAKNAAEEKKTDSAGEIQISMYHSWSADTTRGAALGALIEEFNTLNAGKIKVTVDINSDFPAYQEKVKTMIATDTTPDIFHYNFNPNDLSRQESGKLMDFTPYMDEEWKSRFGEGDVETLTINGQLTSIPFEKAGALIFYNETLFKQAGIDAFPTTWEDMIAACGKLKAANITPFSLFTADDAWYTCNLFSYLAAGYAGTEALNAGGSVNTPEMINAAKSLRQFMDFTTADFVGANYSVAMNHFSSGKTAMVIDGPWLIGSLTEMEENVSIAQAPTFGDGVAKQGLTVTDAQTPWASGKQSDPEKEKAIVAFMKFITSEEATKKLTLEGSVFLSAKLNVTQDEMDKAGKLLANYITVNSKAPESTVNLQRNLATAANAELPTLLESLALDLVTPEEFIAQLDALNQ